MEKLIVVEETTVLGYHYTDNSGQIPVIVRRIVPTTGWSAKNSPKKAVED
jgi:hypothetical protein